MTQIWLRRVHGLGGMAHVLRGVEGLEGQSIQEVSGMQQSSHWPDLPSSLLLQDLGQVFKLWNLQALASQSCVRQRMPF